jgi:threonine dehydrogenase-like Zn-dependent dehydrogenase
MRATVMYGAHDVRVETVPDPQLVDPTDALVRVTRACICGSDLWPYNSMAPAPIGNRMGHEFIGLVEDVGAAVRTVKKGDLVVAPFAWSDGTCEFCRHGLQTSCLHGGWWGGTELDGGQGEAVRVPQADGTLVVLPVGPDHALMPSLLTLSDVMGTGHHAALAARVRPGNIAAVVGDGAVGLCGVIAARRLGAERIIMLGRHADRIALARAFGASDIVSERGTRRLNASASSQTDWARTRCSSASVMGRQCGRRSASRVRAARSAVSACRRRPRFRTPSRPSTTTSQLPADRRRYAPTSKTCSPTCSRGESSRAACSTA